MPDNFHIDAHSRQQNNHKRVKTMNGPVVAKDIIKTKDDCGDMVRLGEPSVSPDQRNSVADSLLSKHNGWITIDDENRDRKQAPETF